MHLLLPPSETKAPGGRDVSLDLEALSFTALTPIRRRLVAGLIALSRNPDAARAALRVSGSLDEVVAANTVLATAPTMAALDRYTGVLYDALDASRMTRVQRSRAEHRLVITSALFGLVRATDPIPAYRLSAGSRLPETGTVPAVWKDAVRVELATLAQLGPVVDLRSGAYAAFGALPAAIGIRVLTEAADGRRAVVSHFNKATKGRAARVLATSRAEVTDAAGVAALLRRAGFRVERRRSQPEHLDIITDGLDGHWR